MLGKLLKYEFQSLSRLLALIYAAVLVAATFMGLMSRRQDTVFLFGGSSGGSGFINSNAADVTFFIFLIIYIVGIVAILLITLFMIIERFYRNMLCGEGYLMHTLPVPTWMHVAAKTICALAYSVISVAVLVLSVLLLIVASGEWGDYVNVAFSDLISVLRESGLTFSIWLMIIATIVQLIRVILQFYISMSIGGAAKKNKLLFSVLTFIAICIVTGLIQSLFLSNLSDALPITTTLENESTYVSVSNGSIWLRLLVNGIYSAIFFAGSTFFLKKKLNLE